MRKDKEKNNAHKTLEQAAEALANILVDLLDETSSPKLNLEGCGA